MRFHFLLYSLIPLLGNSQIAPIKIPEADLNYVRQTIDSLDDLLKSGQAKKFNFTCLLPQHQICVVRNNEISLSNDAMVVKGKQKDAYIYMVALKRAALDLYNRKDYQKAVIYWRKALEIAVEEKFLFDEIHDIRVALNNVFFLTGDYHNVMEISSDGLSKALKLHDLESISHFNNVLGCIMMKLKNFDMSGRYFSEELRFAREGANKRSEAHALLNFADLCIAEAKMPEAMDYVSKALNIYRSEAPNIVTERTAYTYNKLAEGYRQMGNNIEALRFNLEAIQVSSIAPGVNQYDRAAYFINAGTIYYNIGKNDSALYFLRKSLFIAKSIKHRELMRDTYDQLSVVFAAKHVFDSAFFYQRNFNSLNDSLLSENNERDIMQREASLQIERQKRIQDSELAKQQLWRNVIIAVALVLLITLGSLYNRYRLRQKNLYQQELNKQQNVLFNAIANTQEQERKRIARDLHDSLGSVLSAAKLKMAAARDSRPELSENEHFQTGIHLLDEASSDLRDISHNIMPATLSKLGLIPALKNLCNNISSEKGLQINFIAYDLEERLEEQTEISIYRIMLELINNIVKHAQASKATVQLIRYPSYINITIEDNGKGFDFNKISASKNGIGLGNVAARVEYLKGRMEVDSGTDKGTTIILEIPV